jgi:hypothetical protein
MLVLSCSTSVVVVTEDDVVAVAEAEQIVADVDEEDGEEAAVPFFLVFSSWAIFLMCVRQ